jgi:hypothetical protein
LYVFNHGTWFVAGAKRPIGGVVAVSKDLLRDSQADRFGDRHHGTAGQDKKYKFTVDIKGRLS